MRRPATTHAWAPVLSRLVLLALGLLFASSILAPAVVYADGETTLHDLANATDQREQQNITVKGEVVGDILFASPGYKWLLLHDGNNTISVLVKDEDAEKIAHLGRYGQVGAQIEVVGRFKVDCDDHDGLTDIHATGIKVLEEGYDTPGSFDVIKLEIGLLLILIGISLHLLHKRLRERTR